MEPIVNVHTHTLRERELSPRCEGVHPWQAEVWHGELLPLAEGCEAVGEIGLDYACKVDRHRQEELFRIQLRRAEEHRLPVILHCVKAFEPVMRILGEYPLVGVVFHGFIGSWQQAERAIKKGYYLSFGERSLASPRTVEAMQKTPPERLFFETDESLISIEEIYQIASGLLSLQTEELKEITRDNFKRLFKR